MYQTKNGTPSRFMYSLRKVSSPYFAEKLFTKKEWIQTGKQGAMEGLAMLLCPNGKTLIKSQTLKQEVKGEERLET
jgi:hypothetical protein